MSELKWAHGPKANITEPLEAIKEQGWQYGDVPTASNFNWLFKELTFELKKTKKELAELKSDFVEVQRDLHFGLRDIAVHKLTLHDLEGSSRQICRYLWELEPQHSKHHSDMSFGPLPYNRDREV